MEPLIVVTRPLAVRIVSGATLAVITAWAVLNGDLTDFGVLAYPAIIALQTVREWLWRLEVTKKDLHEKQVIGAARTVKWSSIDAVIMPDASWWRINPVLRVAEGPNIQLTATPEVAAVLKLAEQKRKEILGTAASVSIVRTLAPWMVLLALASLLFGAELAVR